MIEKLQALCNPPIREIIYVMYVLGLHNVLNNAIW